MAKSGEFVGQEYEVAQAGADIEKDTRRGRAGKIAITTFFSVAILLSISVVAFSIVFFLCDVRGSSMMMTINASYEQDATLRDNALANRFATPDRSDIIVASSLDGRSYIIKRVIGLGGDRIRMVPIREDGSIINVPLNTRISANATAAPWVRVDDVYDFRIMIMRAGTTSWTMLDESSYLDTDRWGRMMFYGENFFNYINTNGMMNARRNITHSSFVPFGHQIVTTGSYRYLLVPQDYMFYMGDNRGSDEREHFGRHSFDGTAYGARPMSALEGVVSAIIPYNQSFASFIWNQIVYVFTFRWLFG